LTAIGVTGLGMGRNKLIAVHNDVYGAGYTVPAAGDTITTFPGAIYYASRTGTGASEAYVSTVEQVSVDLGDGNDVFAIDSTYSSGTTEVRGGVGNDTLTISSTVSGLHPAQPFRADFVTAGLTVLGDSGSDTIIVDDSGDLTAGSTGTFDGAMLTGSSCRGYHLRRERQHRSVAERARRYLYVPDVDSGISVTLKMGDGADTGTSARVRGREHGQPHADCGGLVIERARCGRPSTPTIRARPTQTYNITNSPTTPTTRRRDAERHAGTIHRTTETVVLNAGSGGAPLTRRAAPRAGRAGRARLSSS
jgi:hypothetical protein